MRLKANARNKDRKTCQFKVGDLGWLCAYPPIHAGFEHIAKLSPRWYRRFKIASFFSQVTVRLVDPKIIGMLHEGISHS